MFNNMKNKIREKTGTELPKFNASTTLFTKSKSSQHSRQNSQGSIASITSEPSGNEENDSRSSNSQTSYKSSHTPEKTISNDPTTSTIYWENKFHEKEKEWREKEKAYVSDLLKQTKELQETISLTEDFRRKYTRCQEEKEHLEVYQKQEISKIKELLLSKEEENNRNITALKNALISIDSLKQEVNRLKPFEEQINHCQKNKSEEKEVAEVTKFNELMVRLEVLSKENEALKQSNEESRRILDESLVEEMAKNSQLDVEIVKLKEYTGELETALETEKKVKDQTLLRNAEISQRVQISEQEVKEQLQQNDELFKKVNDLESQLESSEQSLKNLKVEHNAKDGDKNFQNRIMELENEITEKNKTIRILQQNLNDVRKTFQTELKNSIETNKTTNNSCPIEEDINFKYMKHVLIKFLTSSEYEAQQLTKAVATLLKLSSEEERLIRETLEWRSSWFGLKPRSKPHFNPS